MTSIGRLKAVDKLIPRIPYITFTQTMYFPERIRSVDKDKIFILNTNSNLVKTSLELHSNSDIQL